MPILNISPFPRSPGFCIYSLSIISGFNLLSLQEKDESFPFPHMTASGLFKLWCK